MFGASRMIGSFCVFSLTVTLTLLAQPSLQLAAQGTKDRKEEEEEKPGKNPPKKVIDVEDDPTPKKGEAAERKAVDREMINFKEESQNKKNAPAIRSFFQAIAIPYDELNTSGGQIYYIALRAERELPAEKLTFRELNKARTGLLEEKELPIAGVSKIVSYEEVVLREVEYFLRRSIGGVSRQEQFEVGDKTMTAILAFHDLCRTEQKRVGKAWDEVKEKLKRKQQQVKRDLFNAMVENKLWIRCTEMAAELTRLYPEDQDLAKDISRMELVRADATIASGGDKELVQLRNALLQFERMPGGAKDPLTESVRKRLREKAESLINEARNAIRRNDTPGALVRLRMAETLYPDLPGIADLRSQLKDRILYVGVPRLPERMSPSTANSDSEKWAVELLFESLLQAVPDSELGRRLEPMLSNGMPRMVPLGREIRLHKNVTWNKPDWGDPLVSLDVQGTLRLLQKQPYSWASVGLDRIKELAIEDSYRFRLLFDQGVIDPLSRLNFKILPAQYLQRNNRDALDDAFARQPFGSGPYRYEGQEKESTDRVCAVFRANPQYGQRNGKFGLPNIREIRFFVPNPTTDIKDIQAGQLHLMLDVPTGDLGRFRNDDRVKSMVQAFTPSINRRVHLLAVNHRKPILQSSELRRGIALSIDRNKILQECYRAGTEFHQPMTGPFPPKCWATLPKSDDLFKLELARPLFATVVTEKGPFSLFLKYPADDPRAGQAVQRMKEQIEAAGDGKVKIILDPVPTETYRRRLENDFDFDLAYTSFDYQDDWYRLDGLFDPLAGGRGGRNYMGFLIDGGGERERRILSLMNDIKTSRNFTDEVKGKTHDLHKTFNQTMPFIPLWQLDRHIVASTNLEIFLEESKIPVAPKELDPAVIFTSIERWRLK